MKSNLFLSALLLTAAATLGSCSKDKGTVDPVGNSGTANFSYQLQPVNTSSNMQRTAAGGNIVWTSGFANPSEIRFTAKGQNGKTEYKTTNTSEIDLFSPVPAAFGGLILPPDYYREIEARIKLDERGNDPALQLEGVYSDGLGTIPVVLMVDDNLELKTEMKDVTLDNATEVAAITQLDLASYTDGITENMIRNARLTNGTLIISEVSNRNLYNIIRSNITGRQHKCEYKYKKR